MGKAEEGRVFLLFFYLLSWMNYFCGNKMYTVSESVILLYSDFPHRARTFSQNSILVDDPLSTVKHVYNIDIDIYTGISTYTQRHTYVPKIKHLSWKQNSMTNVNTLKEYAATECGGACL